MNLQRQWVTPLTIGAFVLMAVTGVLMFFHLDRGLNKLAHEWLGWIMVVGVVLHSVVNWGALVRHFRQTTGRVLIGVFVLVLGLSFFAGAGQGGEPPFAAPVHALARVPLSTLAQVGGLTSEQLRARLQAAGVTAATEQQSLEALIGADLRRQVQVLGAVLKKAP